MAFDRCDYAVNTEKGKDDISFNIYHTTDELVVNANKVCDAPTGNTRQKLNGIGQESFKCGDVIIFVKLKSKPGFSLGGLDISISGEREVMLNLQPLAATIAERIDSS